ncbi:hypothetical protein ACWKTZ_21345 [Bacillus cereus]
MQLQNLIKRKNFWILIISFLIGLVAVVSIGVKYVELKNERVRMEAKEEETKKETEKETEQTTVGTNTIFNLDWETFKNQWYNYLNGTNGHLSVITDMEEKPSAFSIRHNGKISKSLFVGVNTDEKTGKVIYAAVIGTTNTDVVTASANLIALTDSSLTAEKKKQIILQHLGLGNGKIETEKILSYSHNGITYQAEYEPASGGLATLTVSVEKQNK